MKAVIEMKALFRRFFHLNARKRVLIALGSVMIALTIMITGVGAWIYVTGVIASGKLTNPEPVNSDGGGGYWTDTVPLDPLRPVLLPQLNGDGSIKNPSAQPLVLRVSLKEIVEQYGTKTSSNASEPAPWNPVVFYYPDLKGFDPAVLAWPEISPERIRWNEAQLGPKPVGLHVRYQLRNVGTRDECCDYVAYQDVRDAGDNLIGIRAVGLLFGADYYKLDSTTLFELYFYKKHLGSFEYQYYSESDADLVKTRTQWTAIEDSESTGDWASTATWITKHPTLENVVKDWNEAVPLVKLQGEKANYFGSVNAYLEAPNLTKTVTAGKWFYNENDGYFYYVGILSRNMTISAPFNTGEPIRGEWLYNGFFKEVNYRVYGEAIEANKDAAAELWGLTYEPGSLGAVMFG